MESSLVLMDRATCVRSSGVWFCGVFLWPMDARCCTLVIENKGVPAWVVLFPTMNR